MDPNQIAPNQQREQGQQYADKLGERKLDANELHLINKIKAHGPVLEQLLTDVEELIKQRTATYGAPDGPDYRALALGKTNIQQGYMWLVRAVSAPNGLV